MLQPSFAAAHGQGRTPSKIGSWWASQHYKDLDARTGGELSKPENAAYDLAIDGAELMHLVTHSTLLGYIRNRTLPAHLIGQHKFCKLVLCIPGPQQPSCMDAYLNALGAKLAKLAEGITVVPGQLDSNGRVVQGEPFVHKGFISGLYADGPARANLLYSVGAFTAYLSCVACRLTGTRRAGVVRYLGYTEPVTACAGPGQGQSFDMSNAGASQRRFTADDITALINTAEQLRQAGLSGVGQLGYHGKSPLLQHLPYVDASTLAVVPFAHAFNQGVAKDFFRAIFATFPKKKKQAPAGLGASAALPERPAKRVRTSGGAGGRGAVAAAAAAAAGAGSSRDGNTATGSGHRATKDAVLPPEKLVPYNN